MKIDIFCIKILRFGVYISVVAPFIVVPWTIYPYLYGKALYINILTAILLPFYLILMARRPDMRPRRNRITMLLGIFFIALVVSSIFGADMRRSIWGSPERSASLFFLLHYLLLFFIAVSVLRDLNSWKKLFLFSFLVSLLVVGSAWWDIAMDKITHPGAGTRTGGVINNPIFYAGYLLFHIPLAVWFFSLTKENWKRIAFATCALVETVSLFYTLTRGAMLAFILSIVLGLLILGATNQYARKYVFLGLLILCCAGIALVAFRHTHFVHASPFGRLLSISPSDETAHTRLESWKIAWQGFLLRPIFGWGLENFSIIFNKFYKPELLRFSFYETWSDRPHSIIFELLATTGIVGFAAYISLFGAVIFALLRMLKHEAAKRPLAFSLLLIFIAYFIQNLFGIDTPSTLLPFYLFLSFMAFLVSEKNLEEKPKMERKEGSSGSSLGVLGAIIALLALWQWAIEPAYAGHLTAKAAESDDAATRLLLWQRALMIKTPWSYDAETEYIKDTIKNAEGMKTESYSLVKPLFEKGEEAAQHLATTYPHNAYFEYLVGRFYTEWGRFDGRYFDSARVYLDRAIALSPKRQQIQYGLGRLLLLTNKKDEMVQVYKTIVELDPGIAESHWFYGLALREVNRGEDAYTEIKQALRFGYNPRSKEEALVLAEVANKENDLTALLNIYEQAIIVDPKNADWYAKLAALYLHFGRKEDARNMAIKGVELDPSLKDEAAKFLKLLQ